MKVSGFALLVLGVVMLVYGGITAGRPKAAVERGATQTAATPQNNIPWIPLLGAVTAVGGILLSTPRRRRARAL